MMGSEEEVRIGMDSESRREFLERELAAESGHEVRDCTGETMGTAVGGSVVPATCYSDLKSLILAKLL